MDGHHMKTFFSCGFHRSTFLISELVIKSHHPRKGFTLDPFRPASRNALNRMHACPYPFSSVLNQPCSQVTVISCLSINVPSPSAGKSLIYSQRQLQMLDTEQNFRHTNPRLQNIILWVIITYNGEDNCTGHFQDQITSFRYHISVD